VTSKQEQISQLADDIIADAELMRTSVESLVLKASRLARLVEDTEAIKWLHFEQHGYILSDSIAKKYFSLTNRWINFEEGKAYFAGIAVQEASIEGYLHQIAVVKSFRPSGNWATAQFHDQQRKIIEISNLLNAAKRVIAGVRFCIQQFAAKIYNELVFSGQANGIFQQYQQLTDTMLASTAAKAFDRLPSAFERLSDGSNEAVSHALTTCRRVLDAFIDSVFPPQDDSILVGHQWLEVKANHTRNRLRAFVHSRIGSGSRCDRITKCYSVLYDRVSAGVHDDVDIGEARALVLQTYLIIGECLSISTKDASK
jgi:hypothetical protein